jgi:Cof subfamily protein (haloacid dehalogenase superfamily)
MKPDSTGNDLLDTTLIDMIAIDIDGTLLDSQGEFSAGALTAIDIARNEGVQVALVTGRNRVGMMEVMNRMGMKLPYICSGGAFIANSETNEVIQHTPVPRETIEQVVALARKAGTSIFVESHDRIFAESKPEVLAGIQPFANIEVILTDDLLKAFDGDPKKIVMIKDPDSLADLEENILQEVGQVNLSYSSPIYLEVTKQGVNKGNALIQLARYLSISLSRVAAIGDENNDLSMFSVARLAIVMGNATAEIKAAGDLIAPSNDEGGVAWAIKKILQARTRFST